MEVSIVYIAELFILLLEMKLQIPELHRWVPRVYAYHSTNLKRFPAPLNAFILNVRTMPSPILFLVGVIDGGDSWVRAENDEQFPNTVGVSETSASLNSIKFEVILEIWSPGVPWWSTFLLFLIAFFYLFEKFSSILMQDSRMWHPVPESIFDESSSLEES